MAEDTLLRFGQRLGPALCRNGAEQETFRNVYAAYVSELLQAPPPVVPPGQQERPAWYRSLSERAVFGLLGLLLLAMVVIYLTGREDDGLTMDQIVNFSGPNRVREGGNYNFTNETIILGRDSTNLRWEWREVDQNSGKILSRDTSNWHFSGLVAPISSGEERWVHLSVFIQETDQLVPDTMSAGQSINVICQYPPPLLGIYDPDTAPEVDDLSGTNFFTPRFDSTLMAELGYDRERFNYEWKLDGATSKEFVKYLFQPELEPGRPHEISLKVSVPGSPNLCSSTFTINYTPEKNRVILPIYDYQPVRYERVAGFRPWWPLTLLALWLIGLAAGWRRWKAQIAAREAEARRERERENEAPAVAPAPDAAPYAIPWVSQENTLPLEASHLALARAMRHRAGTEGRRELDAARTLKATIAAGGFPEARFVTRERAGEYVLLIDEVDGLSHQGRLFKRLAGELTRRDVYAEVFYYQRQLNRCWNEAEPHGIAVEELANRFGGQRLLLLGNGHEMLDHHATERPDLTAHHLAWLAAFPQRLILTPNPPVAWGFEEKVLYRYFDLYPADGRGILEAASRVNDGLTEDRPDYGRHEELQLRGREGQNPHRLRWRRVRELEAYFTDRPDLLLWARALCVHPSTNFDLTVAIGHALEPFGVVVNYDNLLELSRWKALDEGHFRRKLREELLAGLDRPAELAARAALAEELRKAQPAASGGFAARELENVLAVQTFTLDHSDAAAKASVAELLRADALDPDLVELLQREVELEFRAKSGPLATDPFKEFEENFTRSMEQLEPLNPEATKEDGPRGWAELKARITAAYEGNVGDMIRLLEKDVPYYFPEYERRTIEVVSFIKENILLPTYEKQPFRDIPVFSLSQKRMEDLLTEIRNNTQVWASELDTENYTATQAVSRMIATQRYEPAIRYLDNRGQENAPDGFRERMDQLADAYDNYLKNQSPPRKATKQSAQRVSQKAAPGNFSERILISSIESLAADIDQLARERQQAAQRAAAVSVPPLEEYFNAPTDADAPEAEAIAVARPVWWPLLAAVSGLCLFLLFLWLYPKHNTAALYTGPETKDSWFVREKAPEEASVLRHQDAIALFKGGDMGAGMQEAQAAVDASPEVKKDVLLNVLTAVYNYYAERYNDPDLISGAPDTNIWDIINAEDSYYGDYETIVGNDRSLDAPALGRMNDNYYHLLGLVEEAYATYNGTPINYSDQASDQAFYYQILRESGYFDTLSYRPNLLTLISRESSRIISSKLNPLPEDATQPGLHLSGSAYVQEAYRSDATYVDVRLIGGERTLQRWTLTYPEGAPEEWLFNLNLIDVDYVGPSDSVGLELINDDFGITLDKRAIAYPYRWERSVPDRPREQRDNNRQEQTAVPEQTTVPEQTNQEPPQEIGRRGQSIVIQVIDAITDEPVGNANIVIREGPEGRRLSGTTDGIGTYVLDLEGLSLGALRGTAEADGYLSNTFPDPDWWRVPRPAGAYNSLLTAIRNGQGLAVGLTPNLGKPALPPVSLYFGPDDHSAATPYSIDDLASILERSAKEVISQPTFYPIDDVTPPSLTGQWSEQSERLRELKEALLRRCQAGEEVTITLRAVSPASVTGSSRVEKGRITLVQLALRNDESIKKCLESGQFTIVEEPTDSVDYPVDGKGYQLPASDYRVRQLNRVEIFVD